VASPPEKGGEKRKKAGKKEAAQTLLSVEAWEGLMGVYHCCLKPGRADLFLRNGISQKIRGTGRKKQYIPSIRVVAFGGKELRIIDICSHEKSGGRATRKG